MRSTMLTLLLAAGALVAAPRLQAQAAQQGDTTHHKPLTPETAAKSTAHATKKLVKRSGRTIRKAGKDTEAQAHRTRRQAKRAIRHATKDSTSH